MTLYITFQISFSSATLFHTLTLRNNRNENFTSYLSDSLELMSIFRQLSKITHHFALVPYVYI